MLISHMGSTNDDVRNGFAMPFVKKNYFNEFKIFLNMSRG